MQLLQYCYNSVLWIQGLNAVLFVLGRVEISVITAVTAVLLQQCAMDTGTIGRVVSSV